MKANPNRLTKQQYRESLNPKAAPVARWGKAGKPKPKANDITTAAITESVKLDIKPLSVNKAWQGKRFRSDAYRQYQIQVKRLLPHLNLPPPPYKLSIVFGFSSKASDADNGVKCFQDIIADHYGFNDKLITELHIKKELVPKGSEFIEFNILTAA